MALTSFHRGGKSGSSSFEILAARDLTPPWSDFVAHFGSTIWMGVHFLIWGRSWRMSGGPRLRGNFAPTSPASGGTAAAAPERRGLGFRLIERGLSREPGGETRITFQLPASAVRLMSIFPLIPVGPNERSQTNSCRRG
jgi:hypothetical protein